MASKALKKYTQMDGDPYENAKFEEISQIKPVRGGQKKYEIKEYKTRASSHDLEDINEVGKEEEMKEFENKLPFDQEEGKEEKKKKRKKLKYLKAA